MSGKRFRRRDPEYFVLLPGKPKHFPINPYNGSKKQCKYVMVNFIWMFNPHFPLGLQIKRLKCKYKRLCVPAMNLRSVKIYGLWDV